MQSADKQKRITNTGDVHSKFDKLQSKTQLSGSVIEDGKGIAREVIEGSGNATGRGYDYLVVASTSIACDTNNIPVRISELAEVFNIETNMARKEKRKVQRVSGRGSLPASPDKFLERYLNELDIPYEKTVQQAHEALDVLTETHPNGAPSPLAAGAIAYGARSLYIPRQEDISEVCGTTKVTIRKYKQAVAQELD